MLCDFFIGKTSANSGSSTNLTLLIVTAVVLIFVFSAVAFTVYWCTKKNYPQCQGDGLIGVPRQRQYKQLQTGKIIDTYESILGISVIDTIVNLFFVNDIRYFTNVYCLLTAILN